MDTEKRVPEEERIWMGDFPLKPEDWVVMTLECDGEEYPSLGRVLAVGSRNPDPGVAIELKTPEEFDQHTGGAHSGVKLSRYDSMWAEVEFCKPHCEDTVVKTFFTYQLKEMLEKNELSIVPARDHFVNMKNFVRYVREPKGE